MKCKSGQSRSRPWQGLLIGPVLGMLILLPLWTAATAGAYAKSNAGADAGWFVDMNRFAASAHAAFKCEDCHGTMMEGGSKHPDPDSPDYLKTPATRRFDYSRCRKCHQVAHDRYLEGGHAKALAKEAEAAAEAEGSDAAEAAPPRQAPTCGECHVSHYERSKKSRVAVGQAMVSVCGRCHRAHSESYMDNVHGRSGVDLENEKSAYCSDCHGAHRVVSLKKAEDALPVCRRCHPKAEAGFADVVIHAAPAVLTEAGTPKDGSILWIQRIRIAALAVVAVSLVFFFGHSLLWLLREIHEKLRKH